MEDRYEEIKSYYLNDNIYRRHNIIDVVEKYNKDTDLIIILKLALLNKEYFDIETIIRKFPRREKFDKIKIDTIFKCANNVEVYDLCYMISSIYSDNIKIELFKKYFDRLECEYLYITLIINSIKNDNLKSEYFREYIDYYDSDSFSDYLRNIKDDEFRTSEFLLYKDKFSDYTLDWIAGAYQTDSKKMEIFDTYFTGTTEQIKCIASFIGYDLNDENNIILCVDKYSRYLEPSEMGKIIFHLKNNDIIIDLINRYSNIIPSKELKDLLLKIDDLGIRYILLDNLLNKLDSNHVIEILKKESDCDKKMELFDKYFIKFNNDDIYQMYGAIDDDKKEFFLDKYINYENSYVLFRICGWNKYFIKGKISTDTILNKYIEIFNPLTLSYVIKDVLLGINDNNTITNDVLNYLLSKTNNKDTIKMIYNAVALVDPELFVRNLFSDDNIFNAEERDIMSKLANNNIYFYGSFIFELLNIPCVKNNTNFLKRISRYEKESQELVFLYKKYPNRINLLLSLLEHLYKYDINYDSITNILIKVFKNKKNSFLNNIDYKNLDDNDKINLIFNLIKINENNTDSIFVEINDNTDLVSYEEKLDEKVRLTFNDFDDIENVKNFILNKLFGVSLKNAVKLIDTYGKSLDKFDDSVPIVYIKTIKKIVEEDDTNNLLDLYSRNRKLSIEEKVLMEQNIKKVFNDKLRKSLYKVSDKEPNLFLNYADTKIPVYYPDDDFFMLVNSVSAYRLHGGVEDYIKFWNSNENIKNHGICTSLISNQNVGQTAPINDVLFGFEDFSDNSIQLADCMDIGSSSDDIELSSHKNHFMLPDDYVNNTRSGHNELVLERLELRKNIVSKYGNIQPSYVIIYDNFDINRYNKSLKAAYELGIPIVYLDTEKIAINEYTVLKEYEERIINTLDISLFEKYLVRLENNIYGFNFSNPEKIKKYFSREKSNIFMDKLVSKINNSFLIGEIDSNQLEELFNKIITILQKEDDKCKYAQIDESLDMKHYIDAINNYLTKVEERKEYKSL